MEHKTINLELKSKFNLNMKILMTTFFLNKLTNLPQIQTRATYHPYRCCFQLPNKNSSFFLRITTFHSARQHRLAFGLRNFRNKLSQEPARVSIQQNQMNQSRRRNE